MGSTYLEKGAVTLETALKAQVLTTIIKTFYLNWKVPRI